MGGREGNAASGQDITGWDDDRSLLVPLVVSSFFEQMLPKPVEGSVVRAAKNDGAQVSPTSPPPTPSLGGSSQGGGEGFTSRSS